MEQVDYARAERFLARRDPVLGALIRQHGRCRLADAQHEDPFRAIIEAIVWQQLSGKAAATIFGVVIQIKSLEKRKFCTARITMLLMRKTAATLGARRVGTLVI